MSRYPDPADLYPEVAAVGSLAAALELIASEQGLDLRQVAVDEKQPLNRAKIPSATPDRKAVPVSSGAVERVWMIEG